MNPLADDLRSVLAEMRERVAKAAPDDGLIGPQLVAHWADRLTALLAEHGGEAALYGMFRAIVDAGGPETIARHGVERGADAWQQAVRAGMLAIERRFHPERFDDFPADYTTPPPQPRGDMVLDALRKVVAEALTQQENDRTLWTPEWQAWKLNAEAALAAAPGEGSGESEHVRKLVGKLDQWRKCMSHNESYFGEPAGLVKSVSEELAHAVDPIYPPMPEPVNPLAGVAIYTSTTPLTSTTPPPASQSAKFQFKPFGHDHECRCANCGNTFYGPLLQDVCETCASQSAPSAGSGELSVLPDEGAFIIVYEDASVDDERFVGCGAKDAALQRYEMISPNWNAHLYVKVDSNSRACEIPNARLATAGQGVELIAAERQRQMSVEGWTPEHDDEHTDGALAVAAACYAAQENQGLYYQGRKLREAALQHWPWERSWWKPTPNDRVRELVKAGALIAAEIDRLQRAAAATPEAK